MPEAAGADVDSEGEVGAGVADEDEDVVGVAELEELEEPELPQPAATSATSTTLSAASRRRPLFVAFSNVVIGISGSSVVVAVPVATVVLPSARSGPSEFISRKTPPGLNASPTARWLRF
jgi:hypothetical protein